MCDKNSATKEVERRGEGGCDEFVYRNPCQCSTPMWELISSQPQLYNSWRQPFFYLLLKHAPLWANQPTAEQLFASLLHLVAANLCTRTQNPNSHLSQTVFSHDLLLLLHHQWPISKLERNNPPTFFPLDLLGAHTSKCLIPKNFGFEGGVVVWIGIEELLTIPCIERWRTR